MSVYKNDHISFLKESLDSILIQTHNNWVLRIKIDGPVASSIIELIEKYKNANPSYDIKFFYRDENLGLAKSLNELIEYIIEYDKDVTYIARMDADDINFSDRLEEQILFLEENKTVDVIGSSCKEFGANFSILKEMETGHSKLVDNIFKKCPFVHPSVIFRKSIFLNGFRYPIDTILSEDLAFWFLLLENGYKFSNIKRPLIHYRTSDDMLKRRKGLKKAFNETKIKISYMKKLRMTNMRNIIFIFSYFLLRISPTFFIRFLYRYLR
ncbi:glycosyltransferase [Proteus mirabilis]|uniref:glycosyltransferase n=1 Tax=Proteus mirabilis TaxID=584 RepID=UPI0018C691C7|nr:glycosyltransferase [Proteus mirabilis]MBG2866484.1 glycosyltransferase [Proteus mirabilis]MCL8627981.1 glycosyltransferase [Proteus mirabilis]MCL8634796.1 glycosyltransferase [Proteus mirabilis]MDF7122944.1 glycosyltransferase [Proteus mirabilis]MDF7237712.1 glycosyltransferase [Proteus mirabilis]